MKRILFVINLIFVLTTCYKLNAQVVIGADKIPERFSMVQLEGKGGLRLPVLTTQQRDALALNGNDKALGLIIYHKNPGHIEYWDGNSWVGPLLSAQNGLSVQGNAAKIILGGDIIENTLVDLKDKNLYFNFTTGEFHIGDQLITVRNDSVGINTENPQGIFHVNAGNDITVNSAGKIGIGMQPEDTDNSHLQIKSSITIKNAGETPVAGTEYILATTDGTGQVKWVKNHALRDKVVGQLGGISAPGGQVLNGFSGPVLTPAISSSTSGGTWTGAHITLPPGVWIIQSVINVRLNKALNADNTIWFRLRWSLTPTSPSDWVPVIAAQLSSGHIYFGTDNGMIVGSTILENSGATPRTYYLNIYYCNNYGNNAGYTNMNYVNVGSANHPQNSIVAYPLLGDN